MKKRWMTLVIGIGVLMTAVPAWAATLYTVRLAADQSATALDSLRQSGVGDEALWSAEFDGRKAVCCGLFAARQDAVELRERLGKGVPDATVVSFADTLSRHWLPYYRQVTLADLGFARPVVAQGFTAFASFHFPWNGTFSPEGGYLRLYLNCSPILNDLSTIRVNVEGIPAATLLIKPRGPRLTIDVPLDWLREVPVGPTLDVEVYGHLSITDDRCVDEPSGNLWLLIDNASYLQVRALRPPQCVHDFLADPGVSFNVVTRSLERHLAAALCSLSSLLGAISRGVEPRMVFSRRTAPGPNIYIGDYLNDVQLLGNNLYLTARGVDLLAARWSPASPFAEVSKVEETRPPERLHTNVTFADLGFGTKVMRGIGDLTMVVPFTTLQLGAWPAELTCTLVYATTPVEKRERAFLKLKLNGVLIGAHGVIGEGTITTHTFRVPSRYLRFSNSLEITLSYYLNRGNCQGSLPEMEVSVFKDSFLSIQRVRSKPPLSLSSFPAVLDGRGALVIEPLSREQLENAARLLAILAQGSRRPLRFDLVDLQTYQNRSYGYGIFSLQPAKLKGLQPIVDLAPAFQIVHPLTRKVLLRFTTSDPVAVLQAYYHNGVPLLVFSQRSAATVDQRSLRKLLLDAGNANVELLKNSTHYAFEIGDKLRVVYPFRKDLGYYWNQYRLIMFLLFAALALLFLLYLYRKLAKR